MERLLMALDAGGILTLRVFLVLGLLLFALGACSHIGAAPPWQMILGRLKELRWRHVAVRRLPMQALGIKAGA